MNLLKALERLSATEKTEDGGETAAGETAEAQSRPSAAPSDFTPEKKQTGAKFNAMQSVLDRHEIISNRVKSASRRTDE